MSESGRSSPYTSVPGFVTPRTLNGKLTLETGLNRLIQYKTLLTGWRRPEAVIVQSPVKQTFEPESGRFVFQYVSGSAMPLTAISRPSEPGQPGESGHSTIKINGAALFAASKPAPFAGVFD